MKIKSNTKKKVYNHLSLCEREMLPIGLESGKIHKEILKELEKRSGYQNKLQEGFHFISWSKKQLRIDITL